VPDVPTRYVLELSDEASDYLSAECHRDPKVRGQIQRKFAFIAGLLEQSGTLLDGEYIDKFVDEVWEIRIDHSTGAYRMFFATGMGNVLAVACGGMKKRNDFTPSQKKEFVRRCRAYIDEIKNRKA
jgi:phage-related protein